MGITYRTARPDERDAVIDFINYVFSHDHEPHDFKTLIPKEYGDGREGLAVHFLAADERKGIRGCVAVRPFTLHAGSETLKGGFVGSVSVHPYARGEGHMKRLMQEAHAWMRAEGLDLAVLSGQRQRYEHFGYRQAGPAVCAEITRTNLRHCLPDLDVSALSFREVTEEDDPALPAIRALHKGQPVYLGRDGESFLDIAATWHGHLISIERDGACLGYLIAGEEGWLARGHCNAVSEMVLTDAVSHREVLKGWLSSLSAEALSVSVLPWDAALYETVRQLAEDVTYSHALLVRPLCESRVTGVLGGVKACAPAELFPLTLALSDADKF